jgi:uncharacterized membrane protein
MSATILTVIVLIVMWVVVLVPLLVRRAEESEEALAAWAADAPAEADDEYAPEPAHDDTAPHTYDDTPRRARATAVARRRRVLTTLALLMLGTAAGAVLWSPVLWLAQAVCDILLFAYVGKVRADARRAARRLTQARRAERSARRRTHRQPVHQPAPRPAAPARRPSQVIALDDEDPSFAQWDDGYPRAANE